MTTRAVVGALNQASYRSVVWVAAIAETLHNVEEAIWLPGWSRTSGVWHPPVGAFEFRFADAVVTLLFYAVIYFFWKRGTAASRCLLGGVLVVILFNVLVPHLAATIATARYAPGVVTGILLNVPVTVFLLRRGLSDGIFSPRMLAVGTAAVAALALPLLLASFGLGRAVAGAF